MIKFFSWLPLDLTPFFFANLIPIGVWFKDVIIFLTISNTFYAKLILRNQAAEDLFASSTEVFHSHHARKGPFIEFKQIVSTNSTLFQPISFCNQKIFLLPIGWMRLFSFYMSVTIRPQMYLEVNFNFINIFQTTFLIGKNGL